jgi:hypothetical protein
MTMHSIMIQEMARNVQADRQRAAERRRPVSAEPEIYPAIDSVVVSHSDCDRAPASGHRRPNYDVNAFFDATSNRPRF